VGRLSDAQQGRVAQYSERAPLLGALRDRDNRRLQARLLELLRSNKSPSFRQDLVALAQHWDRGREPAYAAALQEARRELFAMLLDLDRTLTPEQRALAVGNLRRYAAEFRLLSAKGRR
jgi:hypothetical protein